MQAAQDLTGRTVDPFEMAAGKAGGLHFCANGLSDFQSLRSDHPGTQQEIFRRCGDDAGLSRTKFETATISKNICTNMATRSRRCVIRSTRWSNSERWKLRPRPRSSTARARLIYHGRIDNWYKDFGRARSAPTTHELDDAIQAALNSHHPAPASVGGIGCYISDLQ